MTSPSQLVATDLRTSVAAGCDRGVPVAIKNTPYEYPHVIWSNTYYLFVISYYNIILVLFRNPHQSLESTVSIE